MEKYGFGVDIGGTTCKFGLFDREGMLVEKWEIPTDRRDEGAHILEAIVREMEMKLAQHQMEKEQLLGVGVGVPGPVLEDGVVNRCINLGWGRLEVSHKLREMMGVNIKVGNDANVAALGELLFGCGNGCGSMLLVTLGTGVGGGIVLENGILYGAGGAAGEIGHITVNPQETELCSCGRRGCLEQYVSATGIERMLKKALTETKKRTILSIENVNSKALFDAAKDGDELAIELADKVAEILGKALGNVATILNPEMVALGGGVSGAGELLSKKVEYYLNENTFHACRNTPVVLARLGNDAGIYGAFGMLLEY